MAIDNKPKATFRPGATSGKPGMNPLIAGIIIGLLLGIFLALGVAVWLNRASTPFVEKTKPTEALPAMKTAPPAAKAEGAEAAKPRFEFYQLLPGEKDGAATPPAVQKDAPKATKAATAEPIKSLNETLYLQAGAFQNEAEADNMRAKIAFAGFEAAVKPVNVAGKGALFRVRLGPFKSQEEVNRIKAVLSQNGISAAVVKPD